MKKYFSLFMLFILSFSIFLIPSFAAIEEQSVIKLYDGTTDGWLDNQNGTLLTIQEIDGVKALVHESANDSISLKRKFTVDWSGYDIKDITIKAKIHIDIASISPDASGSFKIKNGDGADPDNSNESNQFNFDIHELNLQKGWNTFVFKLSDAVPDGGDNYKIADWFCIWINSLPENCQVSIGELEIINNVVVADTVAEAAPVDETAAVEEAEADTQSANPQTGDNILYTYILLIAFSYVTMLIGKKIKN